ncbi:MAG TPA: class I SAM-dependent methyltransferase [Candidatus Saccharimonadales bacterium]|nr:class I SAM-dependent methyltransferase [Candidatus Saccharimonadales bacterium]
MGNPREKLHAFIQILEDVPQKGVERTTRPYDYKTSIQTNRFDPSVGNVEVMGGSPYARVNRAGAAYSVPMLGLQVVTEGVGRTDRLLHDALTPFVTELQGSEVEVDTSRFDSGSILDDYFWGNWKGGETGELYRKSIYPAVISAINANIVLPRERKLIAVDIFGGDGEFAELLVDNLTSEGRLAEVHVVDASEIALVKASKLSTTASGLVVVQKPTNLATVNDIFPDIDTQPNLVTAIGGMCHKVINRNEALRVAGKVFEHLAEGGVFIVSGKTPVHLNADDFREVGFSVKQMSIPENALSQRSPYQMYVLKK